MAGERGFLPMSLNLNPGYVTQHWDAVEAGAAAPAARRTARDWRLVREVFVADTDEEAWRLSVDAMMGRMMRRVLPAAAQHSSASRLPEARPEVPD